MMAFVRSVILASISLILILNVKGSTSTKTGFNFSRAMTSAVATKVNGEVITSSPGCKFKAIRAICNESVPFPVGITCFTPRYFAKLSVKVFTAGPLIKAVLSITS